VLEHGDGLAVIQELVPFGEGDVLGSSIGEMTSRAAAAWLISRKSTLLILKFVFQTCRCQFLTLDSSASVGGTSYTSGLLVLSAVGAAADAVGAEAEASGAAGAVGAIAAGASVGATGALAGLTATVSP
jgi:hypothetical protein